MFSHSLGSEKVRSHLVKSTFRQLSIDDFFSARQQGSPRGSKSSKQSLQRVFELDIFPDHFDMDQRDLFCLLPSELIEKILSMVLDQRSEYCRCSARAFTTVSSLILSVDRSSSKKLILKRQFFAKKGESKASRSQRLLKELKKRPLVRTLEFEGYPSLMKVVGHSSPLYDVIQSREWTKLTLRHQRTLDIPERFLWRSKETLKVLKLDSYSMDEQNVFFVLKYFPCLESLTLAGCVEYPAFKESVDDSALSSSSVGCIVDCMELPELPNLTHLSTGLIIYPYCNGLATSSKLRSLRSLSVYDLEVDGTICREPGQKMCFSPTLQKLTIKLGYSTKASDSKLIDCLKSLPEQCPMLQHFALIGLEREELTATNKLIIKPVVLKQLLDGCVNLKNLTVEQYYGILSVEDWVDILTGRDMVHLYLPRVSEKLLDVLAAMTSLESLVLRESPDTEDNSILLGKSLARMMAFRKLKVFQEDRRKTKIESKLRSLLRCRLRREKELEDMRFQSSWYFCHKMLK